MNLEIKFNDLDQATEFASILKDENLRGARVSQAQKEPEEGTLDIAELLPLITVALESDFIAAIITSVFDLLRGVLVENKKVKADSEIEKLRIESNERIEMAKLEKNTTTENIIADQSLNYVDFMFDDGNKKVHFKITKGDETEQAELLKLIGEVTK